MIDINKAVIAKMKKGEETFEILVDCDKALEFKEGKATLDDALATEDVFKNVKQGEHASENEMEKLFGTQDKRKIAEEIIKHGEIQLTAEYKAKVKEQKKKRIIDMIHRNAIDPKTNLPHPTKRIELALQEAKVHIDEFKKAKDQIQEIVKQISSILPLKFETREIQIRIPAEYASKSYGTLKRMGKLLKDEWQNDGSLLAMLEIPAGLQEELESELNSLTHGNVEVEILNRR